jgi:transcriptional regulator with XRE-family HTH domain
MEMAIDLGRQIRSVRKRKGLTQRELAKLAGLSVSLVSKVEQGEHRDVRLETLRKLALALDVRTTDLMAPGNSGDASPGDAGIQWASVDAALRGNYGGQSAEPPSVDGVNAAIAAAMPLFQGNRFSELRVILPSLIRDADALGENGRSERARVLHLAGLALIQTRQFDLADAALLRALGLSVNRLETVAIANSQCWLLMRQGKLADTFNLAVKWSDQIEPRVSRATMPELSAWGGMLIRVSTAAIRNNQPADADDAIRLASGAAATIGREYASPADPVRAFGPVTVAMKSAENALIEERPKRVLTIAERIPASPRPISEYGAGQANRNRHLLDVAQANVMLKKQAEAFDILQGVGRSSPAWIANQRFARDILVKIIDRRRTLTTEMREMADFLKLDYA